MPYNSLRMTHTDGTMHHLGVNETHIAKKVILVPDPMDVPYLAAALEDARLMGDYREYVTYTGKLDGECLTVMSCGFGCMPMAIAVEELWHLGVREIVKVDVCAAITGDLHIGDEVCCSGAVRGEGVTKEYIDPSYPAYPDMKMLSRFMGENRQPVYFRSHDCLKHESPYAPNGAQRMEYWQKLGIQVMDSETSALYVIGRILGMSTVSLAAIGENYVTGERLNEEERKKALMKLFINASAKFVKK